MLTALGCAVDSAPLVILGFLGVGAMNGAVLLARTAAADMYPPERRARAISYVLFGALFGAALGPLVFRPLFAGKDLELDTLVIPWFAAAAIAVVGMLVSLTIRPDPRTIAPRARARDLDAEADAPPAPLREILARPGVPSAVIAALASFAVMVSVMNLSGYIVVGHDHEQADVFTVISLHIVGMYALVLVIGELIDRIGRHTCLVSGLVIMSVSTVMLAWVESIGWSRSSCSGSDGTSRTSPPRPSSSPTRRPSSAGGSSASPISRPGSSPRLSRCSAAPCTRSGAVAIAVGSTVAVVVPALALLVGRRPSAAALEPTG